LAIKGFPALLALAGLLSTVALVSQGKWLRLSQAKHHGASLALLAWVSLSAIWSVHDEAEKKLVQLFLSIFFATSLFLLFAQLSDDEKAFWRRRISISIGLGLGLSLLLGPWHLYAPTLGDAVSSVLELIRQVNRSLTIVAILVFIYAGSLVKTHPRIAYALLAVATTVAFYSESQSAALAMTFGLLAIAMARLSVAITRRLILASFALSLLVIAPFSIRAFEQNWSDTYLPQAIQNASPNIRSWIYYVYSKEFLSTATFGRGLQSSRHFNPENLETYTKPCKQMPRVNRVCATALESQRVASHAHNLFLQILFELGIVGGFLSLLALGKWLPRKQSENEIWRTGAWAAAMGTLMFSYNFWQAWLMASLLICALCATILLPDDAAE
jgi:hypothetical protein